MRVRSLAWVVVALGAMGADCGDGGSGGNPDASGPCQPTSCTALVAECGMQPDGCGGALTCGVCPMGENCGGGGANLCGTMTCIPATCASLGNACGSVSDGCGNILACGGCANGATCGATIPNRCDGQISDADGDGAAVAQGDCDDANPLVGPMAVEIMGNVIDDDCDGMTDEAPTPCDATTLNKHDATSLAAAMGLCDPRFLLSATLSAADPRAAAALPAYGTNFGAREGTALAALSTGIAAAKSDMGWVKPNPGTDFGTSAAAPDPTIPLKAECGQMTPTTVNDLSALELRLRAPKNARSFKFAFSYFTADHSAYVCTDYLDAFLVMMQSPNEFPSSTNIAKYHDLAITADTDLLTICKNGTKPQAMKCATSETYLAGSGYGEFDAFANQTIGGATGWVTTTAPVTPEEEVVLRFLVYDKNDHNLDSAVILDQFAWSAASVSAPTTAP